MKKAVYILALVSASASFATPLKWTCDWPEARAQAFSLYQGETATFEPTFRVNGELVTNATIEAVWYQTNGMANAWWKLDGATFAPSNDCGAAAYRFFVEARIPEPFNLSTFQPFNSKLYRANGTMRMLPSPGFSPNALPLPVETLDFAAVEVANAPWPGEIVAATNALAEACDSRLAAVESGLATNAAEVAAVAASTNGFVKKTGDAMTGGLWVAGHGSYGDVLTLSGFANDTSVALTFQYYDGWAEPWEGWTLKYYGYSWQLPSSSGRLATDSDITAATNYTDAVAVAMRDWAVESYGATNVWYDRHGEWLRLVETDGGAETNVVWDQATATTNLYAAWVTSGTFDAARIPALAAGKITSGTFDAARIPNLAAGKITSGTLGADRIPGLAASKITSGTFADARLPHTAATTNRLHYVTGVLTLNLASGATLLPPASATQWPEGAAVFTVINPAGAYTVDPAVKLLGYGSWPTNTAECVVVRSAATSTNYFVNVLREAGE